MMIDFFIFSWGEVLTSLRFVFVLVWVFTVLFLTMLIALETKDAFIYYRFMKRKIGKVDFKNYWPLIKYCYQAEKSNVTRTWDDGSYWNGFDNWAYYDKKKGEWVTKKELTND